MTDTSARTGLQLRSTVKQEGIVELSLVTIPTPEPRPDEVIVRFDASPINPSDQGLLFAGADMSTAKISGTPDRPVVTASIPQARPSRVRGGRRANDLGRLLRGLSTGGQSVPGSLGSVRGRRK